MAENQIALIIIKDKNSTRPATIFVRSFNFTQYLAYLHYKGSDDKTNLLRSLTTNKIHLATDEQNVELQNTIMANPSAFVLIAGKFKYRRE